MRGGPHCSSDDRLSLRSVWTARVFSLELSCTKLIGLSCRCASCLWSGPCAARCRVTISPTSHTGTSDRPISDASHLARHQERQPIVLIYDQSSCVMRTARAWGRGGSVMKCCSVVIRLLAASRVPSCGVHAGRSRGYNPAIARCRANSREQPLFTPHISAT